jgi:P4 family phage/plasmid primase-like protien
VASAKFEQYACRELGMDLLNQSRQPGHIQACSLLDASMTYGIVDLSSSQKFIDLLTGGTGICTFQTFGEKKVVNGPRPWPSVIHGTLEQQAGRLKKLNHEGHGIFVCVNETDGQGRKSENIVRARSLFLDLDGSPLDPVSEAGLKPHMVVESSPGRYHVYWLVNDVTLTEFTELQSSLALRFDGDQQVKDLPRVMRLPGFLHQKREPFLVRLLQRNDNIPIYSKQSIVRAFGLDNKIPIKEEEKLIDRTNESSELVTEGRRNSYMVSRAGTLRNKGLGMKEIYAILSGENRELCHPPLTDNEIKTISGWIETKVAHHRNGRRTNLRPMDYVDQLTEKDRIISDGQRTYVYKDGVYQEQHCELIRQTVLTLILDDIGNDATTRQVNEVVKLLQTKTFRDPCKFDPPDFMNVRNGLIRLADLTLLPHSPDLFTTSQIPVQLIPGSTCPRWEEYVCTVLQEKDQQDLLQEFFGYCLTTSTIYHKALFLLGEGGNGKSGVMAVLKSLVGPSNYSTLLLSDLSQRFRQAELKGKLVNFCAEVESGRYLSDAHFKSLVSGESITVERKGQDPFDLKPTVKFVIAGNRMPQTKDSSYGLQRRLLILRFDQQFKDQNEIKLGDKALPRVPGLADSIIETELNGVLCWTLDGLQRLRKQKKFTVPKSTTQATKDFQCEIEPARGFVIDSIREKGGSKLHLKNAFGAWSSYARSSGHQVKSDRDLSKVIIDVYGDSRKGKDRDGVYYDGLSLVSA